VKHHYAYDEAGRLVADKIVNGLTGDPAWPSGGQARSRVAEHIAKGRYIGGRFWVGFGGFWAVLEAESALALAPRRFRGRNVKMGKAEVGAFFDFF